MLNPAISDWLPLESACGVGALPLDRWALVAPFALLVPLRLNGSRLSARRFGSPASAHRAGSA